MRNKLNIKDIFGKTITVLDTIPDDIEAPIHSLENCILRNVDLSFHNLEGCYMWSAYCEGGKFISSDLYAAYVGSANFSHCDLSNACMRGISAWDTIFYKANLCGADFSLDNLGGYAEFWNCDFSGIQWDERTNFYGARYDEYTIFPDGFHPQKKGMIFDSRPAGIPEKRLIFRNTHISKLKREDYAEKKLIIVNSTLKGHDFSDWGGYYTDFSYSNLSGCCFVGSALTYAVFYNANLSGCDFSNSGDKDLTTILFGADLRGIIIDSHTKFSGAIYNDKTLFSDNFCPESYGMRKEKMP